MRLRVAGPDQQTRTESLPQGNSSPGGVIEDSFWVRKILCLGPSSARFLFVCLNRNVLESSGAAHDAERQATGILRGKHHPCYQYKSANESNSSNAAIENTLAA